MINFRIYKKWKTAFFFKYHTARSLHRELTNIFLLCTNESNYYYCYCNINEIAICSLCKLCQYFRDCKIDNLSCEKFLQLNYNKKDKLDLLVSLISPFFSLIKSEKKDALHFFSKEYYCYSRDISTRDIKFLSLDQIIEKNKAKVIDG